MNIICSQKQVFTAALSVKFHLRTALNCFPMFIKSVQQSLDYVIICQIFNEMVSKRLEINEIIDLFNLKYPIMLIESDFANI